ncbi:dienelactone hydrolase [Streptomyces sp. WAC 06738]|uniref:dienelactone hydrolase family protein n=1 Tax=Streptomyces sp. WAC 06738 TaxID=2203210 RepID=UPI000F713B6F|nr:dienelactone hydrolase family protein [Streptomyces sp. WAC 06738]AZM45548.1 dienelactone hydrolase [Streptomyces sp. WAC 06738]
MAILLFHSTYGLRPAVQVAAERLRAAGHEVVVPDLFGGLVVDTVEDGRAIRDELGVDELLARAVRAAAPHLESGLVYAGFSLGAALAQNLALADENARGLLLMHGTSDIADGTRAASGELPVQLHVADPDPFEPHDWQTAWYLQMQRAGGDIEVYRYPGAGHLFTDDGLADYDAESAESAWRLAMEFVAETSGRADSAAAR